MYISCLLTYLRVISTLEDISQIKKLEEQANRTGRLAAMGEMAVKIAHEIRNPLGSIELFASQLQKDLDNWENLSPQEQNAIRRRFKK